jgi:apolipoprotein N-acyltransferase
VTDETRAKRASGWFARGWLPSRALVGWSLTSAALLVAAFPNFGAWPLAWFGLVPLLRAIVREQKARTAFLAGWLWGAVFFVASCYWLTYAMIRYGGIPAPAAYLALLPPGLIVGLFPALACGALARLARRWGAVALFAMPFLWTAGEWLRLQTTGQLWNALGYSQAFRPELIQAANWGGVYAVSFLLAAVNAAIAYAVLRRKLSAPPVALAIVGLVIGISNLRFQISNEKPAAFLIAVQPNVPMEIGAADSQEDKLLQRHFELSRNELQRAAPNVPRVVIWPESPMSFSYSLEAQLREDLAKFTQENKTALLFNSLEPTKDPRQGGYNAAVLLNEQGRVAAQYDKIYLLPFGEYVPVPRWLPLLNMIPPMVGDFTPGREYDVFPMGNAKAAVFICFESAFPDLPRKFTQNGADVLINIANDGYLGPTPVQRQHLANAVFRAVENSRPVLRVTNTGLTAYISERGEVSGTLPDFQPGAASWKVYKNDGRQTFYTRFGDVWAWACLGVSLLLLLGSPASRLRPPSATDIETGLSAN